MAYLLFVDESGQDHRGSPYEVLAGAAVHDPQLWNLICAIQDAGVTYFGGGQWLVDKKKRQWRQRPAVRASKQTVAQSLQVVNTYAYLCLPASAAVRSAAAPVTDRPGSRR